MDRDSDIPPEAEPVKANQLMVDRIMKGIAVGMNGAIIPGTTTQADLLSAIFTILHRMLENAQAADNPDEAIQNSHEIGRVLADMLLQFGPTSTVQ